MSVLLAAAFPLFVLLRLCDRAISPADNWSYGATIYQWFGKTIRYDPYVINEKLLEDGWSRLPDTGTPVARPATTNLSFIVPAAGVSLAQLCVVLFPPSLAEHAEFGSSASGKWVARCVAGKAPNIQIRTAMRWSDLTLQDRAFKVDIEQMILIDGASTTHCWMSIRKNPSLWDDRIRNYFRQPRPSVSMPSRDFRHSTIKSRQYPTPLVLVYFNTTFTFC